MRRWDHLKYYFFVISLRAQQQCLLPEYLDLNLQVPARGRRRVWPTLNVEKRHGPQNLGTCLVLNFDLQLLRFLPSLNLSRTSVCVIQGVVVSVRCVGETGD